MKSPYKLLIILTQIFLEEYFILHTLSFICLSIFIRNAIISIQLIFIVCQRLYDTKLGTLCMNTQNPVSQFSEYKWRLGCKGMCIYPHIYSGLIYISLSLLLVIRFVNLLYRHKKRINCLAKNPGYNSAQWILSCLDQRNKWILPTCQKGPIWGKTCLGCSKPHKM